MLAPSSLRHKIVAGLALTFLAIGLVVLRGRLVADQAGASAALTACETQGGENQIGAAFAVEHGREIAIRIRGFRHAGAVPAEPPAFVVLFRTPASIRMDTVPTDDVTGLPLQFVVGRHDEWSEPNLVRLMCVSSSGHATWYDNVDSSAGGPRDGW